MNPFGKLETLVFEMSTVSIAEPWNVFVPKALVLPRPKLATSITIVFKNGQFLKASWLICLKFGKFQALALVSKLVIPEFLKAEFPIVVID